MTGGRLLVSGLDGFVGGTLAAMAGKAAGLEAWEVCALPAGLDVLDAVALDAAVGRIAPDAVVHLAALSNVPDSFRDPERTLKVNVLGTLNLLRALRNARFRGRMVYVGTGDVYGMVAEERLPVDEECLAVPRSPYAVSKLAAEALCRQWTITEGMEILLARPFNHIGPGQSDAFAVSGFARQLARIRLGRQPPSLVVGDLDVTRDFTDVRDVVRAYFAMLARGRAGQPYNVCSGREVRLTDLLDDLIACAGVDVTVRVDAGRLRRSEQRRACATAERLRRDTGWEPAVPLVESLRATLDYWLEREGKDA